MGAWVRPSCRPEREPRPSRGADARWVVVLAGVLPLAVAVVLEPTAARSAAAQVWPPFVLVSGLLLVGSAVDRDGLFEAAGRLLGDLAPGDGWLLAGTCLTVATVTAVLNLDTAVVFLTPVLVHAARRRGGADGPPVIACILVANAASLLLPGSNLTNLLVLGHLGLTGGGFVARTALPWAAAVGITSVAVALGTVRGRRQGGAGGTRDPSGAPGGAGATRVVGPGLVGVAAATALELALPDAAVSVAAVGVAVSLVQGRDGIRGPRGTARSLGAPVLAMLFGAAVAMGTLGRVWSGPAVLLEHLDAVGTAVVAAVVGVVINNLPAASLLAARRPTHPFALLIGLDIGPNLFVTGSLAWVLWRRAVRASRGATPHGAGGGTGHGVGAPGPGGGVGRAGPVRVPLNGAVAPMPPDVRRIGAAPAPWRVPSSVPDSVPSSPPDDVPSSLPRPSSDPPGRVVDVVGAVVDVVEPSPSSTVTAPSSDPPPPPSSDPPPVPSSCDSGAVVAVDAPAPVAPVEPPPPVPSVGGDGSVSDGPDGAPPPSTVPGGAASGAVPGSVWSPRVGPASVAGGAVRTPAANRTEAEAVAMVRRSAGESPAS